jgi:magnesium transporter
MEALAREDRLEALQEALRKGDALEVRDLAEDLHPQDVLEFWDEFDSGQHYVLLTTLPMPLAGQVLAHLPVEEQVEFFQSLPLWRIREILHALDPDDLADALQEAEEQDEELARTLKGILDPATRREAETLAAYEEDEAGGLMTPEFIAVRASMTAEEVIRFLRRHSPDAETIYYLYVLDQEGRLKGVLSLRELIVADPKKRAEEIMKPDVISATTDTDQEEVAQLMADYDLSALPVVDTEGKLVGIVTIDDVVDVLREEATEDIYRLGAVEAPDLVYSRSGILELWRARVVWLTVLIFAGMLTSSILAGFESTLEAITALAFYIPVLLGTGGNTGNQSSTIIIRALSTQDLDTSEWPRVLWKEFRVGILLGLTLAVILGLKVFAWDGFGNLTMAVAVALVVLVLFTNLAGALLPMVLRRIGLDPALISNPLIATASDVSGLIIYLTVARLLISHPLLGT